MILHYSTECIFLVHVRMYFVNATHTDVAIPSRRLYVPPSVRIIPVLCQTAKAIAPKSFTLHIPS